MEGQPASQPASQNKYPGLLPFNFPSLRFFFFHQTSAHTSIPNIILSRHCIHQHQRLSSHTRSRHARGRVESE